MRARKSNTRSMPPTGALHGNSLTAQSGFSQGLTSRNDGTGQQTSLYNCCPPLDQTPQPGQDVRGPQESARRIHQVPRPAEETDSLVTLIISPFNNGPPLPPFCLPKNFVKILPYASKCAPTLPTSPSRKFV